MRNKNYKIFRGTNSYTNITNYILSFILRNKSKKLILTGGKSARLIYKVLFKRLKKLNTKVDIYLSDERCLKLGNKNLNENIFKNKFKNTPINFYPILLKQKSYVFSANRYNKILPDNPSIIFLSVGNDGHIASIFKGSKAIKQKKKIVYEKKKYKYFKRISITMNYLKNKKNILLFCRGKKRFKIFKKLIKTKGEILYFLHKTNPNYKLILA